MAVATIPFRLLIKDKYPIYMTKEHRKLSNYCSSSTMSSIGHPQPRHQLLVILNHVIHSDGLFQHTIMAKLLSVFTRTEKKSWQPSCLCRSGDDNGCQATWMNLAILTLQVPNTDIS